MWFEGTPLPCAVAFRILGREMFRTNLMSGLEAKLGGESFE